MFEHTNLTNMFKFEPIKQTGRIWVEKIRHIHDLTPYKFISIQLTVKSIIVADKYTSFLIKVM